MDWDYTDEYVDISIPEYVPDSLKRLRHTPSKSPQFSPHEHAPIQYKQKGAQQFATAPDTSPHLKTAEKKQIQSTTGSFLYYGREIYYSILPALNDIASAQAQPNIYKKKGSDTHGLRTHIPKRLHSFLRQRHDSPRWQRLSLLGSSQSQEQNRRLISPLGPSQHHKASKTKRRYTCRMQDTPTRGILFWWIRSCWDLPQCRNSHPHQTNSSGPQPPTTANSTQNRQLDRHRFRLRQYPTKTIKSMGHALLLAERQQNTTTIQHLLVEMSQQRLWLLYKTSRYQRTSH